VQFYAIAGDVAGDISGGNKEEAAGRQAALESGNPHCKLEGAASRKHGLTSPQIKSGRSLSSSSKEEHIL